VARKRNSGGIRHANDVTITPRVVMLCWAHCTSNLRIDALANAVGLLPDDAHALVDRVRERMYQTAQHASDQLDHQTPRS
jgi:hypothetical protein